MAWFSCVLQVLGVVQVVGNKMDVHKLAIARTLHFVSSTSCIAIAKNSAAWNVGYFILDIRTVRNNKD